MAIGHFLVIGDKTTCGGFIIDGAVDYNIHGVPQARESDHVTCGRYPGVYTIVGGVPEIYRGGRRMAGNLHSKSSCPCQSSFIASMLDVDYGTYDEQGDPEQQAQSARKGLTSSTQTAPEEKAFSGSEKKQRKITLTLGVFFDGTGNNAVNTSNMQQVCSANYFGFSDPDAEALWRRCADDSFGVSGNSATSYLGHYTNVHWLATLYKTRFTSEDNELQNNLYIEGVGTRSGEPDSVLGQAFGTSDTGVIAKTDNAVTGIAEAIQRVLAEINLHTGTVQQSLISPRSNAVLLGLHHR